MTIDREPVRSLPLRERAGAALGAVLAPSVAAISRLRHARMFHPDGILFDCAVAADLGAAGEDRELGERLSGPGLARLSGALWRRGFEHLDVLGFALRLLGDGGRSDQDLLFATIFSPFTMGLAPFTTDATDFLHNTYWAVSPFDAGHGRHVKLRLVTDAPVPPRGPVGREHALVDAVNVGRAVWRLEVRTVFTTRWRPAAIVSLRAPAAREGQDIRFSPFHCGRGVVPVGFVHAMRRPVYPASQAGRRPPC